MKHFLVYYNYPSDQSPQRNLEDTNPSMEFITFFCSNSCAAYSNAALNDIGGFEEVLLGEDTVATARICVKVIKLLIQQKRSSIIPITTLFGKNSAAALIRASQEKVMLP